MDIVKCTIDGKNYTTWEFSQLPPAKLEKYRRHIICLECEANAYYRKASSDGKPACFGARPHNTGCYEASSNLTNDERDDVEDVNKIVTSEDTIKVNFDLTIPTDDTDSNNKDIGTNYSGNFGKPSKRHTIDPEKHRVASRGLKTLLNYLIHSPGFATSETTIKTSSKFTWKAKNLFVNFEDATESKRPHMYWGMISDADDEINWLNTGGKESVSIPISGISETLISAFDIQTAEDLAGAYAIVFGWCKESSNGKLYIQIKDNNPCHIFIKKP